MRRFQRIIRVGHSLALIIPASVCRDLDIRRGEYFDLLISDRSKIVARRLKIIAFGEFGEERDSSLPVIKDE